MGHAFKIRSEKAERKARPPCITPLSETKPFISATSIQFEDPQGKTRAEWMPAQAQCAAVDAALSARRSIVANYTKLLSAMHDRLSVRQGERITTPEIFKRASVHTDQSLRKAARGFERVAADIELIVHGYVVVREQTDREVKLRFEHGRIRREYSPSTLMQRSNQFELFAFEAVRRLTASEKAE